MKAMDYQTLQSCEKEIKKILVQDKSIFYKRRALMELKKFYKEAIFVNRIDHEIRMLDKPVIAFFLSAGAFLCICFIFALSVFFMNKKSSSGQKTKSFTTAESDQERVGESEEQKAEEDFFQHAELTEEFFLSAVDDYQAGDYKTAIRKLEMFSAASFDGYTIYQYLADRYYETCAYDEALLCLMDYLKNIFGLCNVDEQNTLYQRILAWKDKASEKVSPEVISFIGEADLFVSLYQEAEEHLEHGSYGAFLENIEKLYAAGADSILFRELYTYCMPYLLPFDQMYDEAISYINDETSFFGRQMNHSERVILYDQLWIANADLDERLNKDYESFLNDRQKYEGFGLSVYDCDPQSGKDISGKIKDEDKFRSYVCERLKYFLNRRERYDASRVNITFSYGFEAACYSIIQDDSPKPLHQYIYDWRYDRLYEEVDIVKGDNMDLVIKMIDLSCMDDLMQDESRSFQCFNNEDNSLIISNVERIDERPDAFSANVRFHNEEWTYEDLIDQTVIFENNRAMLSMGNMNFEIILGREVRCQDFESPSGGDNTVTAMVTVVHGITYWYTIFEGLYQ